MMPMAPTPVMPVPMKSKLGFSIEALVGKEKQCHQPATEPRSSSSPPPAHSRLMPVYPSATYGGACLTGYGEALRSVYSSGHGIPAEPSPYYTHHHSGGPSPLSALDLTSAAGQPMSVSQLMLAREQYSLYPWLLARHHRLIPPQRIPGPEAAGFLLHPFRKPKRIRTAFSPSQLLKLEHAFEKNHYVVGAERKQLAQGLGLTETQVKVWFQNRRTKHKRQKQEEEQTSSSSKDGDGNERREESMHEAEEESITEDEDVQLCDDSDEEEA